MSYTRTSRGTSMFRVPLHRVDEISIWWVVPALVHGYRVVLIVRWEEIRWKCWLCIITACMICLLKFSLNIFTSFREGLKSLKSSKSVLKGFERNGRGGTKCTTFHKWHNCHDWWAMEPKFPRAGSDECYNHENI